MESHYYTLLVTLQLIIAVIWWHYFKILSMSMPQQADFSKPIPKDNKLNSQVTSIFNTNRRILLQTQLNIGASNYQTQSRTIKSFNSLRNGANSNQTHNKVSFRQNTQSKNRCCNNKALSPFSLQINLFTGHMMLVFVITLQFLLSSVVCPTRILKKLSIEEGSLPSAYKDTDQNAYQSHRKLQKQKQHRNQKKAQQERVMKRQYSTHQRLKSSYASEEYKNAQKRFEDLKYDQKSVTQINQGDENISVNQKYLLEQSETTLKVTQAQKTKKYISKKSQKANSAKYQSSKVKDLTSRRSKSKQIPQARPISKQQSNEKQQLAWKQKLKARYLLRSREWKTVDEAGVKLINSVETKAINKGIILTQEQRRGLTKRVYNQVIKLYLEKRSVQYKKVQKIINNLREGQQENQNQLLAPKMKTKKSVEIKSHRQDGSGRFHREMGFRKVPNHPESREYNRGHSQAQSESDVQVTRGYISLNQLLYQQAKKSRLSVMNSLSIHFEMLSHLHRSTQQQRTVYRQQFVRLSQYSKSDQIELMKQAIWSEMTVRTRIMTHLEKEMRQCEQLLSQLSVM